MIGMLGHAHQTTFTFHLRFLDFLDHLASELRSSSTVFVTRMSPVPGGSSLDVSSTCRGFIPHHHAQCTLIPYHV